MKKFKWSNRNKLASGRWGTFYYCRGTEMATGLVVYYGRNEWNTEESALQAQEEWETRIGI